MNTTFHTILSSDTIASVLQTLSDTINALSSTVSSQHFGGAGTITLTNLETREKKETTWASLPMSLAHSRSHGRRQVKR